MLNTIVLQNESLGLGIDCETATAHWYGERIDYDHALMVAMASRDSGDTRPRGQGRQSGIGIRHQCRASTSGNVHK